MRICDACHDRQPRNHILFSRKVNGDEVELDFCDQCLHEINQYIEKELTNREKLYGERAFSFS
jgi:protein-arginine kinase activator protein McsA